MALRFSKLLIFTGFLIILVSSPGKAQILQDTVALNLVKKNITYIYNLQFDQAKEVYLEIVHIYPSHPIVYLLKGLITYWENYPLLHANPAHAGFEDDMRQCIRVSETNDNPSYQAEYLLADLSARGMLLMYYSDNELTSEVTPLAVNTYKYIRKAFKYTDKCTDLYYFTGLYNYYRDAYPKAFPVYKALTLIFPKGDIEKGLKELNIAATGSIVMEAESYFLLTWVYLNFENKYKESLFYSHILHNQYPENGIYLCDYIRNMLIIKEYDEAEKVLLNSQPESENKFIQAEMYILKGILYEKKYSDYNMAQEFYHKGIKEINIFGSYGNEYSSYAYYGLSRLSDSRGEKQTRKLYRKEALKLSDFKKINFDK